MLSSKEFKDKREAYGCKSQIPNRRNRLVVFVGDLSYLLNSLKNDKHSEQTSITIR